MPQLIFTYANDQEEGQQFLRALARERKAVKAALDLAERMGLCQRSFIDDAAVADIINAFQYHKDEVVLFHYGGHAGSFELLLQDDKGSGQQMMKGEGLVSFLGRQKGLKVVVLNGCHTHQLATSLIEANVPVVIGTSEVINDEVATAWAARFYQGLSVGLSIQRAFDDAVDQIKMVYHENQFRDLVQLRRGGTTAGVPWKINIAEGKEDLKDWSLTQFDPLLGLPEPPANIPLPEHPFLFFRRYERSHAPVFFGRAQYIRLLYDRIANPDSPSIILLHGHSGSGKSSLLEAGLIPRLEAEYQVSYLRYNNQVNLSEMLTKALDELLSQPMPASAPSPNESGDKLSELLDSLETELEKHAIDRGLRQQLQHIRVLKKQMGKTDAPQQTSNVLQQWAQIEQNSGRPLVIIIDQLEEIFIEGGPDKLNKEWPSFLETLDQLFRLKAESNIQGKLLLGFRKEFFSEIEKALQQKALARTSIYLPTLTAAEVEEIVMGLTSRKELRERYNLSVKPRLAKLIASELLQKEEGLVAPVLQILLTNMWEEAKRANPHQPEFSIQLYHDIKAQWWKLDNFVHTQLQHIEAQYPKAEQNGLILELLFQHTTAAGTSQNQSAHKLQQQYQHISKLADILSMLERYYLLSRKQNTYSLSHDTLAPIIRRLHQQSDRAGQRAKRILESRAQLMASTPTATLSRFDLEQVEKGRSYIRTLTDVEERLIKRSQKQVALKQRQRRLLLGSLLFIGLFALAALSYALNESNKRLQTEDSNRILVQKSDSLDQDLKIKQEALSMAQTELDTQLSKIGQLRDSGEILLDYAQRNESRAQYAEQEFAASQLAALAINYLEDGQKYKALQLAVDAYERSPRNSFVNGILLQMAYDSAPLLQAVDAKNLSLYQLSTCPESRCNITFEDQIVLQIKDESEQILTTYTTSEIIDIIKLANGFNDRVYLEMDDNPQMLIWEPLLSPYRISESSPIVGFSFNPSDQTMVWATANGKIKTLDIVPGSRPELLQSFNQLRSLRATSTSNSDFYLAIQGTQLSLLRHSDRNYRSITRAPQGLGFRNARLSQKGKNIIAALDNGKTIIYERKGSNLQPIKTLSLPEKTFVNDAIIPSNDSRYLVNIDRLSNLYLWDLQHERHYLKRQKFPAQLTTLAFFPDNKHLLVGCENGDVYFFNWKGRNTNLALSQSKPLKHYGAVSSIKYRPRYKQFIIGAGRNVYLYQEQNQSLLLTYDAGATIEKLAFSPDGKYLWIGTQNGITVLTLLTSEVIVEQLLKKQYLYPK